MKTNHKVIFDNSVNLKEWVSDKSDLIITSPPYPMIEMWDEIFGNQNPKIKLALESNKPLVAFELMHQILDKVWEGCFDVLNEGGLICINIGDATRTINKNFSLYPNHARIINSLINIGFNILPDILWRKQANTPNKFMGSGVLPAGAYVTLEHEYILVARKGGKREFKTEKEKEIRRESAMFWEERNIWYSDVWHDIKGTKQQSFSNSSRNRTAAFPFELAYRLINMFSVKNDTVIDPFLGTGTTTKAAITAKRNSIGYELDKSFYDEINNNITSVLKTANSCLINRIEQHQKFVKERESNGKSIKYVNDHYQFPVVTSQEKSILLNQLKNVNLISSCSNQLEFEAYHSNHYSEEDINFNSINLATQPNMLIEEVL